MIYQFYVDDGSLDNGYATYLVNADSLTEAMLYLEAATTRKREEFQFVKVLPIPKIGIIFTDDEIRPKEESTIQSTPSLADVEIGY